MTNRISAPALSADEIIARLEMKPHPEGGFFKETFRDPNGHDGRAHSTAIVYLLREGDVSRWHRVDAAEVWHWYGGAPLLLGIMDRERRTDIRLGPDILAGEFPQAVVPVHVWQTARSLGAWTLIGCTVAPGFEFSGFELAPEGFVP
jgi:predicted cupin superfamily sugar epimerase